MQRGNQTETKNHRGSSVVPFIDTMVPADPGKGRNPDQGMFLSCSKLANCPDFCSGVSNSTVVQTDSRNCERRAGPIDNT